jgi:nicotinamidase-related amidase
MGAVTRLIDFRDRFGTPTLVLVDLHAESCSSGVAEPDRDHLAATLEACRKVLACARRRNMPIAFVRHMPPLPSFLSTNACPAWIRGIEPGRSDMVFERAQPSCYASSEFAQMAARSSGLVLAGLFGETACLSTLIDGYHRNHHFTYLTDASCSRGRDDVAAADMHRSVTALASVYAKPLSARLWMEKFSLRVGTG